jgi:hypothetical protein
VSRSKSARRFAPAAGARANRVWSFEELEPRSLLSAAGFDSSASVLIDPLAGTAKNYVYTPGQVRHVYGFDQVKFGNVAGDGSGQTIAIVDAYDDPNIAADLKNFDQVFGIKDPPSFLKVNQGGGSKLPAANSGWAMEIALDVEWAHAIAPGANILLVEANSSSLSDLLTAVNYARYQPSVSVVSMSWGAGEFAAETQYDSLFTTPTGHKGVTFVASSGDSGAGTSWPSVSPNVLSVGGTTLTLGAGNTYGGEQAWSGSGGGWSSYEHEPNWQTGVQSSGKRTNPDVAYDGNPSTGFYVYDTMPYYGGAGWWSVGGTSAGAPQWAALIAIADQGRALNGVSSLANGQAALYQLSAADFHDITSGSNGYAATAGYDEVTGRGSPLANYVIHDLLSAGSTSTVAKTGSGSTAPSTTPHAGLAAEVGDGVGQAWGPAAQGWAAATSGWQTSAVMQVGSTTSLVVAAWPPVMTAPQITVAGAVVEIDGRFVDQGRVESSSSPETVTLESSEPVAPDVAANLREQTAPGLEVITTRSTELPSLAAADAALVAWDHFVEAEAGDELLPPSGDPLAERTPACLAACAAILLIPGQWRSPPFGWKIDERQLAMNQAEPACV